MRSLATRDFGTRDQRRPARRARRVQGRPASTWSIVETSGIGQGDAAIVPLVDVPMYVMTPEFGAASQLEKIDMLDFAEFVAINKFDRKGAADALRDVAKQVQRNREAFGKTARRDAGVRHDGEPLQRRRRDRAVPGAAAAPGGARPAARARHAAAGRHPPQHPPGADRARRARALPRRHRRHGARLQEARPGAGAAGARGAAAARERAHADRGEPDKTNAVGAVARPGRRARGAARRRRRGELLADVAASCSAPTPATSSWSRCATRRSAPRSSTPRFRATRSGRSRCRRTRTTARS